MPIHTEAGRASSLAVKCGTFQACADFTTREHRAIAEAMRTQLRKLRAELAATRSEVRELRAEIGTAEKIAELQQRLDAIEQCNVSLAGFARRGRARGRCQARRPRCQRRRLYH